MTIAYEPYLLALKHPFRIATGMRTHTNTVRTAISCGGFTGLGEAAMPPYYGENCDTACAFLAQTKPVLATWDSPENIGQIMAEIDALAPGNNAAKAAVDIALHDLLGKIEGRPLWQLFNIPANRMPVTSFTLGIDTPEVLAEKMLEAAPFQAIKVKLGASNDREIIHTVRQHTDKPIYADANQGWRDRVEALDMACWLQEQGVKIIEQPFHKDDLDSAAWLSERSPLPIFADESFQRFSDLDRVQSSFHGVNIKLMKCTGLHEGWKIAAAAQAKGMLLMTGCMTESSCGIMAAAHLAPLCHFADIDGCWLIANNPFALPALEHGRIRLLEQPGLGIVGAP